MCIDLEVDEKENMKITGHEKEEREGNGRGRGRRRRRTAVRQEFEV